MLGEGYIHRKTETLPIEIEPTSISMTLPDMPVSWYIRASIRFETWGGGGGGV